MVSICRRGRQIHFLPRPLVVKAQGAVAVAVAVVVVAVIAAGAAAASLKSMMPMESVPFDGKKMYLD